MTPSTPTLRQVDASVDQPTLILRAWGAANRTDVLAGRVALGLPRRPALVSGVLIRGGHGDGVPGERKYLVFHLRTMEPQGNGGDPLLVGWELVVLFRTLFGCASTIPHEAHAFWPTRPTHSRRGCVSEGLRAMQ